MPQKISKTTYISTVLTILILGLGSIWLWRYDIQQQIEEIDRQTRQTQQRVAVIKERIRELEEISLEEKQERELERKTLSAQKVTEDVGVEGLEIIITEEKRIINNHAQGYSIEVPDNLLVARSISSDWIELHDKEFMCAEDPSCDPVMRIRVEQSNPEELVLDQWFTQEEAKEGFAIYSPRERLEFGSEMVYRVTEAIPRVFEGFYYYWGKGAKIYYIRIADFDDDTYRPYIETFVLQ